MNDTTLPHTIEDQDALGFRPLHQFDDRRLMLCIDMRVQSYETPQWHLVERVLRRRINGDVWYSDAVPAELSDHDRWWQWPIPKIEAELKKLRAEQLNEGWRVTIKTQSRWIV